MNPLEAFNSGFSVVFPNNRSRNFWVEKALKNSATKMNVVDGYSALTLKELMELFCQQSDDILHKHILTETESFFFHEYHLSKYYGYIEERLEPALVTSAIDLINNWQILEEQLRFFSLLPKEKNFFDYYLFYKKNKGLYVTLPELIGQLIDSSQITLPFKKLYIWGIDDFTPLQNKFLDYLSEEHCVVKESYQFEGTQDTHRFVFPSEDQELHAAMQWLKEQSSQQVCAVVIPSLSRDYQSIHRSFQQFFGGTQAFLPLDSVCQEFVISHGFQALDYPLIETTLNALTTLNVSHCPYMEEGVEISKNMDLETLQSYNYWLQFIKEFLNRTKWCEVFPLSSVEYQVRDFFIKTLDEILPISHKLDKVSYQFVIQSFKNHFTKVIFQPESPKKKNKLVLGLLEAAALPLDSVYLIRLAEQQLLDQRMSHNYINNDLARSLVLPHSSWKREADYLSKMITRLIDNKKIFLSFSSVLSNMSVGHKSYFIDEVTVSTQEYQVQDQERTVVKQPFFDFYPDQQVIWENKQWSISHLNAFFKCPFLGFAYKVGIDGIEKEHMAPISPKDQGIFYHQYIHCRLEQKSPRQATMLLSKLPEALKECEIRKAEKVLNYALESLDIRSYQSEVSWSFEYKKHKFHGRYDLISKDRKTVIDFKSKNFNFSSWFSQSPKDIQGIIYTLVSNAEELGVIKAWPGGGRRRFEDVSRYKESWQSSLDHLIEEIEKGQCLPKPRNQQDCRHCQFKQGCKYEYL